MVDRKLGVVEKCPHGKWFTHKRPLRERIKNPKRHYWCSPAWLLATEDYREVAILDLANGERLVLATVDDVIGAFTKGVWD